MTSISKSDLNRWLITGSFALAAFFMGSSFSGFKLIDEIRVNDGKDAVLEERVNGIEEWHNKDMEAINEKLDMLISLQIEEKKKGN